MAGRQDVGTATAAGAEEQKAQRPKWEDSNDS